MDEKTSLEKSHSKSSNAKLTLLCFVSSIFASGSVALVLLPKFLPQFAPYLYIGAGASMVITVLCLLGLGKFTR